MEQTVNASRPRRESWVKRLDNSDSPYNDQGAWTNFLLSTGALTAEQLRIRRSKGIPCPLCGGADRFRYDNRKGHGNWFCSHCGGAKHTGGEGNGWSLLVGLVGETEAKQLLKRYFGGEKKPSLPPVTHSSPAKQAADKEAHNQTLLAKIESLWAAGNEWGGRHSPAYYLHRGLSPLREPQDLRYMHSLGYFQGEGDNITKIGSFPAILALIRNPEGKPVAVHRTWLTPDGCGKAPVEAPKKVTATPGTRGGAIRLYPAENSSILGLTEGIETAHAVRELARCAYWPTIPRIIPVWACVAERGIRSFVVPQALHASLKTIVVFADNDEAGIGDKAAEAFRKRMAEIYPGIDVAIQATTGIGELAALEFKTRMAYEQPEIEVLIEVPPVMGWDWLDVLVNRNQSNASSTLNTLMQSLEQQTQVL